MQDVSGKLSRLTARLDHMVPEANLSDAQNAQAAAQLAALSAKLHGLLPDPSLSSEERLERLARVIQGRAPDLSNLISASKKVKALVDRLDELLPGGASPEDKIDQLVRLAQQAVPDPGLSVVKRLEKLGDTAAGISPVV